MAAAFRYGLLLLEEGMARQPGPAYRQQMAFLGIHLQLRSDLGICASPGDRHSQPGVPAACPAVLQRVSSRRRRHPNRRKTMNRRILNILIVPAFCMCMAGITALPACSSANRAAYVAEAGTRVTVMAAMELWRQQVVAGKTTVDQE